MRVDGEATMMLVRAGPPMTDHPVVRVDARVLAKFLLSKGVAFACCCGCIAETGALGMHGQLIHRYVVEVRWRSRHLRTRPSLFLWLSSCQSS